MMFNCGPDAGDSRRSIASALLYDTYPRMNEPRNIADEVVVVTPEMVVAGVEALREEGFATSHEDLVSLIYMAMEYQRSRGSRADASFSNALR